MKACLIGQNLTSKRCLCGTDPYFLDPAGSDLTPCQVRKSRIRIQSVTFLLCYSKIAFPYIAKLASKFSATPASFVYSERIFSKYGSVSEEKRARLSPRTEIKRLFLGDNLKHLETLKASNCDEDKPED